MKHNSNVTVIDQMGDDIEEAEFQVAVNGKTFRVMLDDLYSNKIRGLERELASNAVDAQIENGNPEKPFEIFLPNEMYPEFRIRDFGPGLCHADMMKLYVTLFESTKDDNNDVTGAYGLGSKIPFAYTDSYVVTSIYRGEKRTYTCYIKDNGKPGIKYIKSLTVPTDEPSGLEVSVSVRASDFQAFADELSHLVLAFPVVPTVVASGNWKPVEATWRSTDGSVFVIPRQHYGSQYAVKQGCAIYPVEGYFFASKLKDDYNHTVVIDVPIGSVDIKPDREGLQYNDKTRRVIVETIKATDEMIRADAIARLNACTSRRQVYEEYVDFVKYALSTGGFNLDKHAKPGEKWKPGTHIELEGGSDWEPLTYREGSKRSKETLDKIQFSAVEKLRIVIFDSNNKVPREALRYAEYATKVIEPESQRDLIVVRVVDPSKRQIERLVHLAGVKAEQFVKVSSLPDPGPPVREKREKRCTGVRVHKWEYSYGRDAQAPDEVDEIPKHFYWYELARWSNREERRIKQNVIDRNRENGLLEKDVPVLVFTKGAIDQYGPPANMELEPAIELLRQTVQDELFLERVSAQLLEQINSPVIWKKMGYPDLITEPRFAGVTMTTETRERVEEEVANILAPLRQSYPILFNRYAYEDMAWYIDAREEEKTNS